jgi:hypothetical protein
MHRLRRFRAVPPPRAWYFRKSPLPIAAINFGDSTLAIFLAILVPAAFSLLLGHFLFFGRVGDVYLAVITLCVTLILFSFTNSTADPWYRIGAATLGGFHGMDAVPPLNWPGTPDASLLPADMLRLCFLALLWQIFSGTGFPNQFFNDSWVVGFWRADHGRHDVELGRRASRMAQAVLGSPGP